MRGISMRVVPHRWIFSVIAIALIACIGSARAQVPQEVPQKEQHNADALEKLAHQEFGNLSAAERIFVRSAASRNLQWVGPNDKPDDPLNDPAKTEQWSPDRSIRAGLFAWLVADPEAAPFIHPSGPGIAGAKIIGKLDLSYADVARPLTLIRCAIPDGIDFSNASLAGIELRNSVTGPIMGDFSRIKGDLALHFGHYGALSIFRAVIGGDFDCSGADFTGSGVTDTISAQESSISGDASFVQNFTTDGVLYFRLARIGGSLSFNHARFLGNSETGLDAERAAVSGALYWVDIAHTPQTKLDLENASVASLFDDRASWPASGNLDLDGFSYSEFGGDSPSDAADRLQWLALQPSGYRPQPYVQLAKALKQSGRSEGEIEVLIAQRVAQRRSGNMSLPARAWNLLLQATIGYGYRPLRALWWITGFVLLGSVLFGWGYRAGVMTPSEPEAYAAFASGGRPPVHYPHFSALVYSLENFLPVVDLHMGNYWRPNVRERVVEDPASGEWMTEPAAYGGRLLRWYLWFHILAGWTLTPLMFAGLSGLIRME
jgi:hypothetical protein